MAPVRATVQAVPLVATAIVMLDSATDFFPDAPLVGVITPVRLAVLAGLVATVVTAPRLATFRTRLDLAIALLLLGAIATTYVGGHPDAPLRALLTALATFYLLVGVRRSQPESWRAVALLALVCVAAAATSAFAQVTNEVPTGFCRTGLFTDVDCDSGGAGSMIRATGTFANPNLLAAFLVLLTPIALLTAVTVAERTARVAVVTVGLLAYGAVLTTFSRAGCVAAAAGLLVLGGAYWLAPRLGRWGMRTLTTVGLAGLAAVTVALWVVSRAGDALGVRGQAWKAAVDLAVDHPLGVGLGRAGDAVSAAVPGGRTFVHAHNMWLNWLAEAGVAGLLGILLVTVIAVASAVRAAREKSVAGVVGLAALTGFFLAATVDHPANLDRIAMLFWLVLGLVMAEVPGGRRESGTPARATGRSGRRARHH
ncbi:O-antigen ligase family protein [Streptomyces sp. GMR22]|uniref:O-antigen ligase family protein n=1 Tax=Streptomyces sp. GMR22 TaxID=2759524 RepID=UPI0015FADA03|nr:O-antigen ligase family protein [Streptomyces sp. GMR22]MBA6434923.1 O-antigen ligase family protein [Streptomyces sp. GMR22]